MKWVIVGAVCLALSSTAHAQDMESLTLATELGTVIASESLCDLSFDQSAVAAYIESNVAADDMSFASNLQMMVMGQGYNLKDMSPSAKTAHCTQISRVAKSFGFTK